MSIKYEEKYCKMLIDHIIREGGEFDTFSATIGVHFNTVKNWVKSYPEFALAKDVGLRMKKYMLKKEAAGWKRGDQDRNAKWEAIDMELKALERALDRNESEDSVKTKAYSYDDYVPAGRRNIEEDEPKDLPN